MARQRDVDCMTDLKNLIDGMDEQSREIISVDEAIFNQRCVIKKAWHIKGKNIEPKQLESYEPALAVIGACSYDRGWIHDLKRKKSIKSADVKLFL